MVMFSMRIILREIKEVSSVHIFHEDNYQGALSVDDGVFKTSTVFDNTIFPFSSGMLYRDLFNKFHLHAELHWPQNTG